MIRSLWFPRRGGCHTNGVTCCYPEQLGSCFGQDDRLVRTTTELSPNATESIAFARSDETFMPINFTRMQMINCAANRLLDERNLISLRLYIWPPIEWVNLIASPKALPLKHSKRRNSRWTHTADETSRLGGKQ
jgi:hypothetical protein